jgi:carbamoyl-phosphate synthase large subunit
MIRVLVTGVGGGVGQGIIKSLKLINDLSIYVVTADMSELASGLYGGDYSYLVPAASDELYFDRIQEICFEEKIDFYFPGTDVELLNCSRFSSDLKKKLGVDIIVSPSSVIEIADDKYKTAEFLKENGFSYPETFLPEGVVWDEVDFPLIVKPRVGCRSIGVHLVDDVNAARLAIDSLKFPVVQEYINGDEYTCTVAICNELVSDVLCLKRELRAGDTYRAFPVKSERIENYVKKIAVKLGVIGSCNFQLRVTDLGEPKLFEINSRFSGTTPFCSYLGFNPVEFCLKAKLDLEYRYNIDYGKVVLRHWAEVVIEKESLDIVKSDRKGNVKVFKVSTLL